MKLLLLAAFLPSILWANDTLSIKGQVFLPEGCGKKAMVWLSLDKENYKERLLLMHTEVPHKGSFELYVKPGDYQIRASDPVGCEFFQRVSIKNKSASIEVRLVKK